MLPGACHNRTIVAAEGCGGANGPLIQSSLRRRQGTRRAHDSILMMYQHGMRVSETVDLAPRRGCLWVRRLKNRRDPKRTVHYTRVAGNRFEGLWRRAVGAKKTVNLENLEGLGARRLAEILLELGEEDAEIKRRLRLELAGEAGAGAITADNREASCRVEARSILY